MPAWIRGALQAVVRGPCAALAVVLLMAGPGAQAGDPQRGEQLYLTPPRAGQLACADCHSATPIVTNFGGIWAGRNAASVIQRAIQNNTGGMGYFLSLYREAELADIAAYLGNSPSRIGFPSTAQGSTSAARSVTVASSLKQSLSRLAFEVEGDFVITGSTCRSTLAAFSECRVDVAFRPTGEGERSGALRIAHNGTPTPVRIALTGSSPLLPRAVATLGPAQLRFAATPLGAESAAQHAVLANDSADVLTLSSLAATPADFTITGGTCLPGLRLRPGERCLVALRLAPRAGGEHSGTFTVVHDGVGGRSQIALAGSTGTAADERLLSTPLALDFGTLPPGQRSAEKTLLWTQAGSSTLASVPVSVSDARFTLTHHGCAGAVAPLTRCELRLSFTPSRAVATSAELRLGSLRVPLYGRGLSLGSLAAEPGALAFEAALAASDTRRLRLVNDGASAVRLGSWSVSGPEAAEFGIDTAASACRAGQSLEPGSACELALRFTPLAAGTRVAQLRVEHDGAPAAGQAAGAGLAVALSGQGQASARSRPWPAASQLDLGALGPGQTREQRLRVENRGAAVLRWHALALAGDAVAGDMGSGSGSGSGAGAGWQRVDEAGSTACSPGRELAAGAACELLLRFTAPAAISGPALTRRATLVLWAADRASPALVELQAHGANAVAGTSLWPGVQRAAGEPVLAPAPPALVFEARVGQAGAPAQPLRLSHAAPTPMGLAELRSSDPAFALDSGGCAAGTLLMPGESCHATLGWAGAVPGPSAVVSVEVAQTGQAGQSGQSGQSDQLALNLPVQVSEDPAQRSNVGAESRGGGAFGDGPSALWLLALALAVLWLHRVQRRP